MARLVISLNDTKIKNAKAQEKDYTLTDGQGLQLLVKTTGVKLWEFRYNSPIKNKRRKTSFGKYPIVKLADARLKRDEYLELISKEIDPIDHFRVLKEEQKKEDEKNTHTVQYIIDLFYEFKKNNGLAESTLKKDKKRVTTHFIDKIGANKNIHEISFKEVIDVLKPLEDENKIETLSRVKNILVNAFKYAYGQDILEDTELFGRLELYKFKKQLDVRNNPTLTKKDDIKKLYNSILNYKNIITKYLMIFSIHTAQRQGTIIRAKWENIDFEKKLWTISKEDMKMKREHKVPLSDIMIKYLKELKEYSGDGVYLFPNSQEKATRNKNPFISNNTANQSLRNMGFTNQQQTAHGLRAMFKTVCKEHQESDNLKNEFVERILAHKVDGEIEAYYNRAENIEDMRKVVEWWSNWLES
jgi:integrase